MSSTTAARRACAARPTELLQRGLAGAQHLRRRGQADQFERADALVQLRARGAQHAGSTASTSEPPTRLGLLEVAAQRLVRRLERAAQFVLHPGQGAQVVDRLGVVRRSWRLVGDRASGLDAGVPGDGLERASIRRS